MFNWRKFTPWMIFLLAGILVFTMLQDQTSHQNNRARDITFSELLTQIDEGRIHDVTVSGNNVSGHFIDNRTFNTYAPVIGNLIERLQSKKVQIAAKPPEEQGIFITILINILPILLFIGVWIFMARRMNGMGGRGGVMGFGKSKAKLLETTDVGVTFDDVAGVDEAKEAKAISGEAGVPFFHISGSDFVEMFVGVGASRVRDMFEQAKKNAPCIIFVDEIDAVGRNRGVGLGGGNDEREQTLNALLVEMDGFNDNAGIIVIAATNRVDVLDPALLRPGRFDRQINVPNPDFIGREKILKVHSRKVPLAPDVDLKVIARGTPGFSGADLMNLVNEAALLAARRSKRIVTSLEFEDARDKILMGAERRSLLMTEQEKKMTAYHEGGHALVSLNMDGSVPIHKATIIPRGRALGMVQSLPERDQISQSYKEMIAHLAMAMGGRVAEEIVFGEENVTSGAAADIQQASKIARAMVTQLGFSKQLGKVAYTDPNADVFNGPKISEETQKLIDFEVQDLIDKAYDTAKRILTEKRNQLDTLANGLLTYETLSGQEILDLLEGKMPVRD